MPDREIVVATAREPPGLPVVGPDRTSFVPGMTGSGRPLMLTVSVDSQRSLATSVRQPVVVASIRANATCFLQSPTAAACALRWTNRPLGVRAEPVAVRSTSAPPAVVAEPDSVSAAPLAAAGAAAVTTTAQIAATSDLSSTGCERACAVARRRRRCMAYPLGRPVASVEPEPRPSEPDGGRSDRIFRPLPHPKRTAGRTSTPFVQADVPTRTAQAPCAPVGARPDALGRASVPAVDAGMAVGSVRRGARRSDRLQAA